MGETDYAHGPVRLSTHVVVNAGNDNEAVDVLWKAAAAKTVPKTQYQPTDILLNPVGKYMPRLKSYYDIPSGGHIWGIEPMAGKPLFYIFTPKQYTDRVQAIHQHFMELIHELAAVLESNGSKIKLRSDISPEVFGALCEVIAPGYKASGRSIETVSTIRETIHATEEAFAKDPAIQDRANNWKTEKQEEKSPENWSYSQRDRTYSEHPSHESQKKKPKELPKKEYVHWLTQNPPPPPHSASLPQAFVFEEPVATDEEKKRRKKALKDTEKKLIATGNALLYEFRQQILALQERSQEILYKLAQENKKERLNFASLEEVQRQSEIVQKFYEFYDEDLLIKYWVSKGAAFKKQALKMKEKTQQDFVGQETRLRQRIAEEYDATMAQLMQETHHTQERQVLFAEEISLRQQMIFAYYEAITSELTQVELAQHALLEEQQEQKIYAQKKMFEKYINNPQKFDQMYALQEKLEQFHVAQGHRERFEQYADTLSMDELKTFLNSHVQKIADMLSIIRQISRYPYVAKSIVILLEDLSCALLDPRFEIIHDKIQEAIFGILWFDEAMWQNWSRAITDYQQQKTGIDLYQKMIKLALLEKETAMKGSNAVWIIFNEEAGVQIRPYEEFSSKVKENIELVNLFFGQINPKLRQLLDLNHFSAQEHNNVLRGMSMALLGAMYAPEYKEKAIQVIRDYMNTPRPADEPIETIVLRELQEPKLYQALGSNMLFNQLAKPIQIKTDLLWKIPTQAELCTYMLFHTNPIRSPLIQRINRGETLLEKELQLYGQRIYDSIMLLPISVHDTFEFLLGSALALSQQTQTRLWVDFIKSFQISACYNATANKIAAVGAQVRTMSTCSYSTLTQHKLLNMSALSTVLNTFEIIPLPVKLQQFTKEQAKIPQNRTDIEQEYQQWKASIPFGTWQSHGLSQVSIQAIYELLTHPETKTVMYTDDEILEALFWETKINSLGVYPPVSISNKYGFV